MIVDSLGTGVFLRDYWQRRPVLLRQALPAFTDPISPEELAGLACETDVESRLVFSRSKTWRLKDGPFKTRDFTSLPKRNWTLLVQAVDQWVPAVRQLLETVSFLPSWRVDDVMISYAAPNGGVGPHFDYYDVFLVQGQGSRVWKTGQRATTADTLRTDGGLKLLKRFQTEHEWRLERGDVLYVPPGIAHWGVSVDNSLCYSIGFRAPSLADAVRGYADELARTLSPDQRVVDPKRRLPLRSGEIDAADLKQLKHQLRLVLHDDGALARWFGRHVTETVHADIIQSGHSRVSANAMVQLHPSSRLAWIQQQRQVFVFIDGEQHVLPGSAAVLESLQALSRGEAVTWRSLGVNSACRQWSRMLLRAGKLRRRTISTR